MTDTHESGAPRNFTDITVLITGGGSGVGLACAELYGRAGANLLLVGRAEEKLKAASVKLASEGITVSYLTGDVQISEFAKEAVAYAASTFGSIDVLINAAGIILRKKATETTDDEWRQIMAINVDGVFYFSRSAASAMGKEGAIINVSSTCGLVGCTGLAAYNTSKGAVIQLTRSMALELAPSKITVNAVAPGAIATSMLFSEYTDGTTETAVRESNLAAIPIGSIATAQEVARAIVFLSREKHITGSILSVDGGYTAQ